MFMTTAAIRMVKGRRMFNANDSGMGLGDRTGMIKNDIEISESNPEEILKVLAGIK